MDKPHKPPSRWEEYSGCVGCLGVFVGLFAAAVAFSAWGDDGPLGISVPFLAVGGTGIAILGMAVLWISISKQTKLEEEQREQKRQQILAQICPVIKEHITTLRTKRAQLRRIDEYGIIDNKKWDAHKTYFVDEVVMCRVPELRDFGEAWQADLAIDEAIDELERTQSAGAKAVDAMSGVDYEQHCGDLLSAAGWKVMLTRATGDQGVDILAKLGECRVTFQCKRQLRPVGNQAVQEALAGAIFEDARFGAVVSNQPYTEAAKQLAQKTEVMLLHHNDLGDLASRLGVS